MGRGTPALGNFGKYAKGAKKGTEYPPDEEATDETIDLMLSMCGNLGQETLIGEQMENFYDWALATLESETDTRGQAWSEFVEMVINDWYEGRQDKWDGTDEIWAEGWTHIAEQSGYHDARDEMGEGVGQEFGQ